MSRTAILSAALLVATVLSLLGGLLAGTYPLGVVEIVDSVLFPVPGVVHDVIWNLRAPRVLAAFACGGLLAAAGVLLQVLLRNPLADSYVLGVSGGASLGALGAMTLGASLAVLHASALVGALAALALVFGLAFRAGGWNAYRVLLTGVVLSAGLSALVSLLLVTAPLAQTRGMLFWLMGDLGYAEAPWLAWLVLMAVVLAGIAGATRLDILSLGDLKARSLGVRVDRLQMTIFVGAAAATVAAVMLGGAIGFVGLIVPHAIRLLGVTQHRALLPLAVLLGGSFLTLADIAARTLAAPLELPVGVLTALLGVPAMLVLLGRRG